MNQRESIATRISSLPSDRRSLLKAVGVGAAGIAGMPLLAACTAQSAPAGAGSSASGASGTPSASVLPAPEPQVKPLLDQQKVNDALAKLDGMVQGAMERPVFPGSPWPWSTRTRWCTPRASACGSRASPRRSDADTVFQLASVSKPLASTVAAGAVGRKAITWTDPVINHTPGFALKDPYVTRNATSRTCCHTRAACRTGAGDLLEDLGFDQSYILSHLNQQPLDSFRSSYNYSNFGYTAGGQAAADAMKMSWEDLAEEILFRPLGMSATSYRHADYEKASNRALIHVPAGNKDLGGQIQPRRRRRGTRRRGQFLGAGPGPLDPPAARPTAATRASRSSIRTALGDNPCSARGLRAAADAGRPHPFLRPGLERLLRRPGPAHARALREPSTLVPRPPSPLLPGEQLGIVALTNGRPQGIPEAICAALPGHGPERSPRQWTGWHSPRAYSRRSMSPRSQKSTTPRRRPSPNRRRANDFYTGSYANSYYGPLTVLWRRRADP